jgi:hypothetical protein
MDLVGGSLQRGKRERAVSRPVGGNGALHRRERPQQETIDDQPADHGRREPHDDRQQDHQRFGRADRHGSRLDGQLEPPAGHGRAGIHRPLEAAFPIAPMEDHAGRTGLHLGQGQVVIAGGPAKVNDLAECFARELTDGAQAAARIEQGKPEHRAVLIDLQRRVPGPRERQGRRRRHARRCADRPPRTSIDGETGRHELAQRALADRDAAGRLGNSGLGSTDDEGAARQDGVDPLRLELDPRVDPRLPVGAVVAGILDGGEDGHQAQRQQPRRDEEEHLPRGG